MCLQVWNADTGACEATLTPRPAMRPTCLAVVHMAAQTSHSGSSTTGAPKRLLAVGGDDGSIQLWDARAGTVHSVLAVPRSGPATAASAAVWGLVALSGARLVAGCADGVLRVWNAATGACDKAVKTGGSIRQVEPMPDSTARVAVSNTDTHIQVRRW